MASLKDMRVRIAATKATQKITKAMQMVAASKLRRAQAAAEAARPYAERMGKVLGSIAGAVGDLGSAPRLLAGTGNEQVHLLLVCTAERGLCGPFNSAIVRLARERANALMAEGKEVKFFCVGRKGYEQLRRLYQKQIIEQMAAPFRAKYGYAPPQFAQDGYSACLLLFEAIRTAGSVDRTKIQQALEHMTLVTPNGKFQYSPTDHSGLSADYISVNVVKNGELVPTDWARDELLAAVARE